jgi:hypothetical protein
MSKELGFEETDIKNTSGLSQQSLNLFIKMAE